MSLSIIRPENLEEAITIDYLIDRIKWEVGHQGLSGAFDLYVPRRLSQSDEFRDFVQTLRENGYGVHSAYRKVLPGSSFFIIVISWDVPDVTIPCHHAVESFEDEVSVIFNVLPIDPDRRSQCFGHLTSVLGNSSLALRALRTLYAYTAHDDEYEERK